MRAALEIDYTNFKNSVSKEQGSDRASLYHEIWDVLYKLQQSADTREEASSGSPIEPGTAYGGVLFDDRGRVLLVEPAGHYDNTVWTWPKGKPSGETTAEAVALREVREETGYHAQVLARVPGSWRGTTGHTVYFVMRPIGPPVTTCDEIALTRWVAPAEAPSLIQQTTKAKARDRDLEVLTAAVRVHDRLKK